MPNSAQCFVPLKNNQVIRYDKGSGGEITQRMKHTILGIFQPLFTRKPDVPITLEAILPIDAR